MDVSHSNIFNPPFEINDFQQELPPLFPHFDIEEPVNQFNNFEKSEVINFEILFDSSCSEKKNFDSANQEKETKKHQPENSEFQNKKIKLSEESLFAQPLNLNEFPLPQKPLSIAERRKVRNRESAAKSRKLFKQAREESLKQHDNFISFANSFEIISKLFQNAYPSLSLDIPSLDIVNSMNDPNYLPLKIKEVFEKILSKIKKINEELDQLEIKLEKENKKLIEENKKLKKTLKNNGASGFLEIPEQFIKMNYHIK